MTRARILLATAGVPAVAIAVSVVLAWLWNTRLPEVVAVHWTNGEPNNSAPLGLFVKIALLLGAALAMAVSWMAVTAWRRGNGLSRVAIGFFAGFTTIPMSGTLGVLIANLDVEDWHRATGSALVAVVSLLVAVVAGVLAAVVMGPVPHSASPSGPADDDLAIGLAPGQRAVWVGATTNRFLLSSVLVVPLVGFVVDQVVMVPVPAWIYAALFVVGAVVTLLGARLGATVDSAGLTIRMGLLGWPRRHFALDRIDHADVADLGLLQGGGFGYRVNPFTGESIYKLRGGPALAIALRKGGLVYVTVDDPAPGAGLLNDLLRQRTRSHDV
ncbi:hypothetical protein [Amycolatopsis sp. CA-230715]|uniref:hypothetical protein n=1 Tax=Amycolatopsis sp. CA-230715 TaxID=2745196 RepID=UPI001C01D921|nr:hypothetical protein [Amycolatopsis sp. CA-230715]QWF79719.1 hypothetical protein HUW46_03129 [Amycolatopsis sp. CA-230715]